MIIIGTRGSDLALWQANFTKDLLEKQGNLSPKNLIPFSKLLSSSNSHSTHPQSDSSHHSTHPPHPLN